MKTNRIIVLAAALLTITVCFAFAEQTIIQYDCIPNYANWGGVTKAYQKKTGVQIPPDMKGSSATMAALEAEKKSPKADCA